MWGVGELGWPESQWMASRGDKGEDRLVTWAHALALLDTPFLLPVGVIPLRRPRPLTQFH